MLSYNHQQLHHIFFQFYIYWGNILPQKNLQKEFCHKFIGSFINQEQKKIQKTSINNFITHFLSLIAIRNKLYCRKISNDGFITYFESYSNQWRILIQELNYQQLYHTFFGFYIDKEHTLTFHCFLE